MKFKLLLILLLVGGRAMSQCDTVTNTTVSSIATTTATVTATPPAVTAGVTAYSLTLINVATSATSSYSQGTTTWNLTGLTACTEYAVYITTQCGFSNNAQVGRYRFTTGGCTSYGDKYTIYKVYGWQVPRLKADSVFSLPIKDTSRATSYQDSGQILIRRADSTLWYRMKGKYMQVATSQNALTDTTTISTRAWRQKGIDSLAGVIGDLSFDNGYIDLAIDYGADTTGTVDASSLLQSAVNTGRPVYLRPGTYKIETTISLPDSAMVFGGGNRSRIKTTANDTIFRAGSYNKIKDLYFIGTKDTTATSQIAVYVKDEYNITISDNHFDNLYAAIIVDSTYNYTLNLYLQGSQIQNNRGDSNHYGIKVMVKGEYWNIVGNSFSYGTYGIWVTAGNTNVSSCQFNGNKFGIFISGGSNDTHCHFTGVQVNHSTSYSLYTENVTGGVGFTGSDFFASNIYILNSTNMVFVRCNIEAMSFVVTNTELSGLYHCTIWGGYSVTKVNSAAFAEVGCRYVSGQDWAFKIKMNGTSFTDGLAIESSANDAVMLFGRLSAQNIWRIGASYVSSGSYLPLSLFTSDIERLRVATNGGIFLGKDTNATAKLHIGAGINTLAPLKFNAGVNLATPENGAMEYDGTNLYFTPSGATRKTIAYTSDISTAVFANYVLNADKTFSGTGSAEVVTFDTEVVEQGITHSTGASPEEITFPTAGTYELILTAFTSSTAASGVIKIALEKWNGSSWDDVAYSSSLINASSGGTSMGTVNYTIAITANDKIRVVATTTHTDTFLNAIVAADGVAEVPAARLTIKKIN